MDSYDADFDNATIPPWDLDAGKLILNCDLAIKVDYASRRESDVGNASSAIIE